MEVMITAINFHDGENPIYFNFIGSRSYHPPEGRVSASVDFRIEESADSTITLTQVLTGKIHSYDDLVKLAYRQLVDRLGNLGALGLRVSASLDKEQSRG